LAREIPHWEAFGEPLIALPRDRDDAGAGVAADEATIVVSLEEEETRDLLQMVPQVYRTRVNEVMLAALSRALARWAGEGEMVIDLEGHGREDLFTDVDVSRTLGWFTSIFPVRLPLGTGSVRESLLAVKERLRAIPQRGFGYGVLRYLARIETLCGQRTPDVVFNYLGQFDQMVAGSRLFGFAVEPVGPWHGPRSRRRHAIEINAMVRNGALVAEIAYNRNVHDAGTIARVGEEFVSALRAIVEHCALPDAGGYTPSDFPLAALSQKSLDRVTHGARDIEDMYPLTPIQRLFHDFGVQESDPGLEQWRYGVRGDVDVDALQAAWNAVIARHPMLRTSFAAEGLEQPLQVVHRNVTVQWGVLDWREADAASIEVRLDELLASDRKRGLPFDRAPLMRVTLVRVDDDEYELIWTHHHLLLDRWSWPLVLSEVGILYDAIRGQREAALAAPVPFREYMDFLVQQDGTRSEAFWRAMFDGYEAQSSLAGTPDGSDEGAEARAELSEEETAALHSYARRRGLSPNVVIQGGWALWLARQLGNERPSTDVVIGLALAGRPPEVRGIDRIIGVTINNLPVRVALQPEQPVASWLADLQARQGELQQYEHTPLDRVMEWSGVPWRRRLFDSLLVFQHHGADSETKDWLGSSLDIQARHAPTKTAFPLSVMVTGSERISLRVTFDPTVFGLADAKCAALGLRESIAVMAARPDATVGALLEAMPPRVLRIAGDPASATRSIVAPETAVETVLASQLAQVLSLDEVGVTESFFDLGGNSLVATRFVARVRDTLRVTVPVRMVFKDPTVRGLARALEEMKGAPGQLERIAMLVQRVQAMSIDEVRHAAAGAGSMQVDRT
jgi:non-ribosomal peptide synthase protein (TIGR01720 family)